MDFYLIASSRPFAHGQITWIHYNLKQADLIYVNYGRAEDFEYLKTQNISCQGKLVIVRYGESFRGDKVMKV